MSCADDLIDFNGCQNNYTDATFQMNENNLRKSYSNNDIWSDTRPDILVENHEWSNEFGTEGSGVTMLVSSEEDLISTNGSPTRRYISGYIMQSKSELNNSCEKQNTMNDDNNMDNDDGFASNDVLTVGENSIEDVAQCSSFGNHVPSMADQWVNTDYNTVLRTRPINNHQIVTSKYVNPSITRNKLHKINFTNKEGFCSNCNEKVYALEKRVFDKRLYHRRCFKCTTCNSALRMNNVATFCNKLYCNAHFTEAVNKRDRPVVVLETNQAACEELPPDKITKNNVEKFRQLESRTDAEYLKPKRADNKRPWSKYTPCLRAMDVTPVNVKDDSGFVRTDVELPTPGTTKKLLEHWNSVGAKYKNVSMFGASASKHLPVVNMNKTMNDSEINSLTIKKTTPCYDVCIEEPTEDISTYVLSRDIGTATPPIQFNYPSMLQPMKLEDYLRGPMAGRLKVNTTQIIQTDELPAEGLTRNMVEFFQTLKKD